MGVSFAPAKRAAVWPRPRRELGRWPAAGRRTADLPLLALPACLSTLETKLWPWPLPRFFGALGRTRKSSSRRSVMVVLPASSGVSCRAKHADMSALARPSRRTRHGGKAAPCRVPPMCRQPFDAAQCRVLLSCLPPLPLAPAPGLGGPAALLRERPARRRTRRRPQAGRVRGKPPARWTAAPKAARSAERMHAHCTRDDTLTNSRPTHPMARQEARQRAANRRPSWVCLHPDRMRNADHGGCADRAEIAAVERCRIGHAQQEQFARLKATAKLQGWQRSAQPVGR